MNAYREHKQKIETFMEEVNANLKENREISKDTFLRAKITIKEAVDSSKDLSVQCNLALLTKCKEFVDQLQQLFTLALIKHPEEYSQAKGGSGGESMMYTPIYKLKGLVLNNIGCSLVN